MQKSILVKMVAAAFVATAFSVPAFAADTIKIGVAGPHTGDLAPYGLPSKDAVEMLAAEVNAKGGVNGKKVELIVVDECSMIDDKIIADLLSYGKRVIFVGDKFQLKPITGVNKLMNNTPDAELTTPRRQALDNSILQVATDIRNGKVITQYGMIGNNVLRVDMDYMK